MRYDVDKKTHGRSGMSSDEYEGKHRNERAQRATAEGEEITFNVAHP